jgi:hypothetical protein
LISKDPLGLRVAGLPLFRPSMDRRAFLTASTDGKLGVVSDSKVGGVSRKGGLPPDRAVRASTLAKPAKSTVLFFLCGGSSHIDMWDMKPDAPLEYRGEFKPIRTTGDDIRLCEHLPLLSKQAHHFAMIHGITDGGRPRAIITPVIITTSPATRPTSPSSSRATTAARIPKTGLTWAASSR